MKAFLLNPPCINTFFHTHKRLLRPFHLLSTSMLWCTGLMVFGMLLDSWRDRSHGLLNAMQGGDYWTARGTKIGSALTRCLFWSLMQF